MKKIIVLIITLFAVTTSYYLGLLIGKTINKKKEKINEEIVKSIEVPDLDSVKDDGFTYVEYYM